MILFIKKRTLQSKKYTHLSLPPSLFKDFLARFISKCFPVLFFLVLKPGFSRISSTPSPAFSRLFWSGLPKAKLFSFLCTFFALSLVSRLLPLDFVLSFQQV